MKKLYIILFYSLISTLAFAQNYASFTQVGPVRFPDDPSVQTTGMGRVSQLVYHPTDSNILFAVTASGGVFKSSNEGISWRPITDFLPQTSCASLAINPLNPNVMYLGTGDANYNGGGLGVWKTNDGGSSWFQSTTGLGNKLVSYILFSPTDTSTLFAACYDGIYKTTNAGNNWTKKTTINSSYRDLKYRAGSNLILYSATNTFFYRSYDNGDTWIQSNINSSITCAGIKIAVCPSDTSRLYCVVWKSGATSPFGGVYKSTNNGTSFTLQVDTPNILGYSSNGSSLDGQGSYNLAIVADPNDANTIYVAGINIWKSTNQGLALTLKSPWAFGVHADKHGFLFSPFNSNKLFVYHDGGLDRSIDGGNTWTTMEDGLSASEFYRMGNSGLYNDYVIGGLQDNGMDVATDKKFSTVRGGDWGGDFVFDAFDSSMLYENGGLRRNIISHVTGNINGQNGIYAIHPNDSNVLFEATTNLFRTTNVRANPSTNVSWTQISSINGNTAPNSMAYAKFSSGTFYVAFSPQSFYRSDDINSAAPSFTQITTFPFNSGEQIKQLETYDRDANIIYVLTNQSRILRSNDKGNNWISLNKNLPNNTIIKFLLNQKVTDSSMYACTAFGVYYRNRIIGNWVSFAQGLPTTAQISDMEIMSDGTTKSRLHISTYGRGIWQTDLYKSATTAPIADFVIQPSSAQSCVNTIILIDNSTYSPTSRKWKITPATGWTFINGTDSFSSRAEIKFTTPGMYFISLTVSNNKGSNIKTLNYNYSNLNVGAGCTTTTNILGGFNIGIYKFEFNTINNSSGAGSYSNEDFSCSNSTVVRAGATYTAWVTNGTLNNENAKIYIDYNNNGIFTDTNELVGTITSATGRHSCNVTILLNPPLLNRFLRMRVVSDFSTVNASCGVLSYGQSEDYAIWIDKTRPTIVLDIPKPTVSSSFTAKFTTSEVVYGFDATDVGLANATLSNFTQVDAFTYTAKITPVNNGMVYINFGANSFNDLAGNINNAFADSTLFFLGIKSYTFAGISVKDSILQTATGGNIICYVPFGTILDSLIASFTLSDTSIANIGAILQASTVTKNNFNNVITYNIKAVDNSITKTYTITVIVNKNTECKMLAYGFASPSLSGSITQTPSGGTISVTVPNGTSLTNLTALFSLSDSAKAFISAVKQFSNVTSNNFTSQVVYKIIAQDTLYSKTYFVNVITGKSKSCDMLAYAIQTPASTGVIIPNGTGGNISVTLPYGTSLNNLIALFTLSDSATAYLSNIKQQSGITSNNFTTTLSYKIVAQDTGFSKIYLVNVTIAPNTAADLFTYNIVSPVAAGTITTTSFGGIVNITVPFATNITNLVAQFTLSDSAKAFVNTTLQQSNVTHNNYTDTLFLTVKAQDGTHTKLYKIIVVIMPNVQCDLLSYKFNAPLSIGVITPSFNGGTVAVIVPFSTNLTNLIANFSLSDSANAIVGVVPQVSNSSSNDFTNPVSYQIKAQNNINTKTYVVTVTKSTGVELRMEIGEWRIYPNPASKELTVDNGQLTVGNTGFAIINLVGQVVDIGKLNNKDTTIDISNLAAGIYYFRVETKDGFVTEKFVKE
jgi:photosystem II stability/assembly factor-like uncharacterized protein